MKYSEDETRRFRPEDVEDARRQAWEEARRLEEDKRAAAEYAAAEDRRRRREAMERRERARRNEARRRESARKEARRKKAAKAKQRQQDELLQEAALGTTLAGKLFITPRQRRNILKWSLLFLLFVLVMIFQNVIFSRITILGCAVNFIPAAILMISLMSGVESGAVFALCASAFWSFGGAILGSASILLLTVSSVFLGALLESSFHRSLGSVMLCCAAGLLFHEAARFFLALFLGRTPWAYWYQVFITALFSTLICPVLYPLIRAMGRIGGNQWKD